MLTADKRAKMEQLTSAWPLGFLQDAMALKQLLDMNKMDFQDLLDYLNYVKHQRAKKAIEGDKVFTTIPCPECKTPMGLYPINTCQGNQLDDKTLHSQYFCPACHTSIFNKNTMAEEFVRLGQQASNGKLKKDTFSNGCGGRKKR